MLNQRFLVAQTLGHRCVVGFKWKLAKWDIVFSTSRRLSRWSKLTPLIPVAGWVCVLDIYLAHHPSLPWYVLPSLERLADLTSTLNPNCTFLSYHLLLRYRTHALVLIKLTINACLAIDFCKIFCHQGTPERRRGKLWELQYNWKPSSLAFTIFSSLSSLVWFSNFLVPPTQAYENSFLLSFNWYSLVNKLKNILNSPFTSLVNKTLAFFWWKHIYILQYS